MKLKREMRSRVQPEGARISQVLPLECLQAAGVNEDRKLGFPTRRLVSELSVPCLTAFVSPLTCNAALHESKKKKGQIRRR